MKRNWLKYKRVLIVDDEPDVLDTLEESLPMCDVVRASNFDEAKDLLERQFFDIAILDIMALPDTNLFDAAVIVQKGSEKRCSTGPLPFHNRWIFPSRATLT